MTKIKILKCKEPTQILGPKVYFSENNITI